jgi:acetyl-CoA acetyltransferase
MTTYHGRTAIAGWGVTEFSRESGRSVLDLAGEACRSALVCAGVSASEVDGIVTFSMNGDSAAPESVGALLATGPLSYVIDHNAGGSSPALMVMTAAMAIESGLAKNVLVFRALNGRSGARLRETGPQDYGAQFRMPIGLVAFSQVCALWFRRHMIETGAIEEDLAAATIAARGWAGLNERARMRTPLDAAGYFASPYVAEPFRVVDCTYEVDGAAAVLVTSLDHASSLRKSPVVLRGSAWIAHGLDIDAATSLHDDLSRNVAYALAPTLWKSAQLGPEDVDFAELYDCFSGVFIQSLEGFGFCGRGEAGDFIRAGATALGGRLPLNTSGGLLCEGYLQGMNLVTEAVAQLQGDAGRRQVLGARIGVVSSGGLSAGSALVLERA